MYTDIGVDLSKILGGQIKILGEKVVNSDKCMGVSQLLGARDWAAPKVYAYVYGHTYIHVHTLIQMYIREDGLTKIILLYIHTCICRMAGDSYISK